MNNISVLDLSMRLPGPLAAKLLGDLGASVTKLENAHHPDPFLVSENNQSDQNFKHWYENINQNKKIISTDKKSHELIDYLIELISKHDIIISSLPDKLLVQMTKEHFHESPKAFIQIKSSAQKTPLHDLNILAESGLLDYHLQVTKNNTLPFMPLAGIIFAEAIALKAQSTYIAALRKHSFVSTEIFLDEVIQSHLNFLLTSDVKNKKETHFLHTGKFPCYNIYQLKDKKHLAVAAIEKKYWSEFLKYFKLSHNLDQFSSATEEELRRLFSNLSSNEIQDVQLLKNCCVTLF